MRSILKVIFGHNGQYVTEERIKYNNPRRIIYIICTLDRKLNSSTWMGRRKILVNRNEIMRHQLDARCINIKLLKVIYKTLIE